MIKIQLLQSILRLLNWLQKKQFQKLFKNQPKLFVTTLLIH